MKTAALIFGLIWILGGAFSAVAYVIWDMWQYSPTEGAIATTVLFVSLAAVAALIYGVTP